jgi:hypothetical protein
MMMMMVVVVVVVVIVKNHASAGRVQVQPLCKSVRDLALMSVRSVAHP